MPEQTTPSLDDLLRVLNTATDRGVLQWGPTAEEETYRSDAGFATVRIAKGPHDPPYTLTMIDQDGTVLDEYRPTSEEHRATIETLYKKARRKALNLEWKLQGLYNHLKSLAGEG